MVISLWISATLHFDVDPKRHHRHDEAQEESEVKQNWRAGGPEHFLSRITAPHHRELDSRKEEHVVLNSCLPSYFPI